MEAVRYKTCYPCVDYTLHKRITSRKVTEWPTYIHRPPTRYGLRSNRAHGIGTQWPVCPCGKVVNPTDGINQYPLDDPSEDEDEDDEDEDNNENNNEDDNEENNEDEENAQARLPKNKRRGIFDSKDKPGQCDFDPFRANKRWTIYCKSCDGIWIPKTAVGAPPPMEIGPQLPRMPYTYKQILELPNWLYEPLAEPPRPIENGQEVWEIRRIHFSRIENGRLEYLVEWHGTYNGRDPTWYPVTRFANVRNFDDERLAYHLNFPHRPSAADVPRSKRGRPARRGVGRPRKR